MNRNGGLTYFEQSVDFLFIADFLMNFRVAYVDHQATMVRSSHALWPCTSSILHDSAVG